VAVRTVDLLGRTLRGGARTNAMWRWRWLCGCVAVRVTVWQCGGSGWLAVRHCGFIRTHAAWRC
jgi:hypothetical protein